ncbi:hypothetical protein [Moraxella equi]|uniref:Uncharacterized protein n=1 Tax=Moraxella equi TaxID=60442 RepID=A0A378QTE0_9GAMM|nr:hypothetical protein [Moraxella equi]OPH35539.1 hypothetical protein B5J93_10655 [Moraxella equi]STZ02663.1 Uncharacterised protein [Moraxella equi]
MTYFILGKDSYLDAQETYSNFLQDDNYIKLYRGSDLKTIADIFNKEIPTNRPLQQYYRELSDEIYKIGCKSNAFINQHLTIQQYGHTDKSMFELKCIERTDSEIFEGIFEKLKMHIIENKNPQKKSVEPFKKNNVDFCEQLKKIDNGHIELISNLSPNEKILIRDYYLALLHRLYYRDFHKISPLLSTSESKEETYHFLKSGQEKTHSIIFEYMLPKDPDLLHIYAIPHTITENAKIIQLLEKSSLPIIKEFPYKEQKEYSIKRRLFSHLMLSISFYDNEYGNDKPYTIINPSINNFNVELGIFDINQETFFADIIKTNYCQYTEFLHEDRIFHSQKISNDLPNNVEIFIFPDS